MRIALAGAGNMGTAIAAGLIDSSVCKPSEICAVGPRKTTLERAKAALGVQTSTDLNAALQGADLLLLAVKPQYVVAILEDAAEALEPTTLVVSVAAGVTVSAMEKALSQGHSSPKVVRAMPNTPALVRQGITALSKGAHVTDADMQAPHAIFSAVGQVVEVPETLLDAVTGLSGSGPAYGYLILEALSDAGVKLGLPRDVALQLATQTLKGACAMVEQRGVSPAVLKEQVTSPGGTTIAGLASLEEGGLRATLIRAVEVAARRARELSGGV